jgi:hypothetical protein
MTFVAGIGAFFAIVDTPQSVRLTRLHLARPSTDRMQLRLAVQMAHRRGARMGDLAQDFGR